MKHKNLLSLKNIEFSFLGSKKVLMDLNFELSAQSQTQAERLGLIGSNGSGKTTFLSVIMGLEKPQSGEIFFKGRKVESKKDWAELRRKIGFVFQNSDDQLFMPTVLEDVAFGPLNMGLDPDKARKKAISTLESLGLKGFEQCITHKLSGGEKRLVALATVLAMSPDMILLDEPTNDLDPATRLRLIKVLEGLPQALMIVSHDWDFLQKTTNRLYLLEKGRLVEQKSSILHTHIHAHSGGWAEHAHSTDI